MTARVIAPGGGPPGYTYNLQAGVRSLQETHELPVRVTFWGEQQEERYRAIAYSHRKPSNTTKGAVKALLEQSAAGRRLWGLLRSAKNGSVWSEIRACIAIVRSDSVVLQGFQSPARAKLAAWLRRPVIYMPHSPSIRADEEMMLEEAAGRELPSETYQHLVKRERTLFDLADTLVFPSPRSATAYFATFEREIEESSVHYVLSGVPRPLSRGGERNPDRIQVAFIGRFVQHKGYDLFVALAERLTATRDDVKFVAAGGGPLAVASPAVEDRGWLSDPRDFIEQSHFVVCPNRIAYFDLLPLEVAALGRGLVLSAVGGSVDQAALLPDSIAAPLNDLEAAVVDAIEKSKSTPNWGARNEAAFDEHFAISSFALNWIGLLESIQRPGHPSRLRPQLESPSS